MKVKLGSLKVELGSLKVEYFEVLGITTVNDQHSREADGGVTFCRERLKSRPTHVFCSGEPQLSESGLGFEKYCRTQKGTART